jgi:hypothetical protein
VKRLLPVLTLLAAGHALAQSSASFRVAEHALNAGGDPSQGTSPYSTSFRVSLDAVGEGVVARGLSSASFRADGGFVSAYSPPGEVGGLRFGPGHANLSWDPESSVGDYAVYRDTVSSLPGLGAGACWQHGMTTVGVADPAVPSSGEGFFYVVTARNRLGEEGTKGFRSSGAERANASPCP